MKLLDKDDIIIQALVLRKWKNTQDPFIVARALGVDIIYCDVELRAMKAYSYNYYYNPARKEIKINSNVDKKQQLHMCAHELGHIVFEHAGKSYYKGDDLDREYCANLFAVAFLYLYNRYKYKDIINLSNYELQNILDRG